MQRRRDPEIGEAEIFLGLGIERGPVRKLLDGADLRRHRLIDLAMIDHVLAEFRRRPGKDEQVVPLAGLDLSEGAVTNLLYRNNIDGDVSVVPLAPVFGHHVYKPLVILRQKVGPFGDLERLLAGESATGKKKERAERGCASRELQEISTRGFSACVPDH